MVSGCTIVQSLAWGERRCGLWIETYKLGFDFPSPSTSDKENHPKRGGIQIAPLQSNSWNETK